MTLDGLSHDEKLVLVALVEAVAMSNGIVSEGEIRGIGKIVEEIGEDDYRKLMDEADTKFDNLDDLKGSLSSICILRLNRVTTFCR